MGQVLLSLWPLFALIVGGYGLRKRVIPDARFWAGADRLNYFVLFPALLINGLAAAPLVNPALPHLLAALLLVLLPCCLGLWLARRLLRWPAALFGVQMQGIVRFNTYLGLAVIGHLYQTPGLVFAAIITALLVPTVNVLSVLALTAGQHTSPMTLLRPLATNPLILSCGVGVLLNLSHIPLDWGLDRLLSQLAAASLPLGLLCVGAALEPGQLRGQIAPLLVNSLTRLLPVPLLALLCGRLLGLPEMETAILVIFFALPTASSAYSLTRQLGGDSTLMAGIITLQTLLSALTLPLILILTSFPAGQ